MLMDCINQKKKKNHVQHFSFFFFMGMQLSKPQFTKTDNSSVLHNEIKATHSTIQDITAITKTMKVSAG